MSADLLYICQRCSVVTFEDVAECPACGSESECLMLGFEIGDEVLPR
jgi:rRNA maturation protein Nop10